MTGSVLRDGLFGCVFQELLDIRNSGEQQGLLLQRVQKEVTQVRDIAGGGGVWGVG